MRRLEVFSSPAWDAPFWHAARSLIDTHKDKVPTRDKVLPAQASLDSMRTDEAIAQLREVSDRPVRKYGTKSADHHQSAKILVASVEEVTATVCRRYGKGFNANPQKRVMLINGDHLWVSPRRLDGAFTSLTNPRAIWEIKEYWGRLAAAAKCLMRFTRPKW